MHAVEASRTLSLARSSASQPDSYTGVKAEVLPFGGLKGIPVDNSQGQANRQDTHMPDGPPPADYGKNNPTPGATPSANPEAAEMEQQIERDRALAAGRSELAKEEHEAAADKAEQAMKDEQADKAARDKAEGRAPPKKKGKTPRKPAKPLSAKKLAAKIKREKQVKAAVARADRRRKAARAKSEKKFAMRAEKEKQRREKEKITKWKTKVAKDAKKKKKQQDQAHKASGDEKVKTEVDPHPLADREPPAPMSEETEKELEHLDNALDVALAKSSNPVEAAKQQLIGP